MAEYANFTLDSQAENYTFTVSGFKTVFPDLHDDLAAINNTRFSSAAVPELDFDGDGGVFWAGKLKTFGW